MRSVELSKSQFLALAKRMANEALRTNSSKVIMYAYEQCLLLADYEIDICFFVSGEKDELWDFAIEVFKISDYIVMR